MNKKRSRLTTRRSNSPAVLVWVRDELDHDALRSLLSASLPDQPWTIETVAAKDWRAALGAAADLSEAQELLWFEQLPESLPVYWLDRLREAWPAAGDALTCVGASLTLPPELTADRGAASIDNLCALLGRGRCWPLDPETPAAMVYSRGGRPAGRLTLSCLEQLYLPFPARPEPPASAVFDLLAELRSRWPAAGPEFQSSYPGVDGRPVVLHVLHEWGGGIERFAQDLAGADDSRIYLGLRTRGRWSSRCYGEALELCLLPSGMPLRRWPLVPAIGSASLGHPGYRQILKDIVSEFGVAGVLVSSMIGHSLDVLALDLPILVVGHDYFPLWPELHCNFGDQKQRFDARSRRQAVLAHAGDGLFGERDPDFWQALYQSYAGHLLSDRVQLVVPSLSVRHNLQRMIPELADKSVAVVPHGLRQWPGPLPAIEPDFKQSPLRLLVLGRIDGGKGLELLRGALPELTRYADLHLLGCGKAGEELFGVSGVHIELDYPNSELPQRLARIKPHAALLLSTVAESFSYTLSELWSLGVVPIATRTGAFAERIIEGQTGLLFSPDARALVDIVRNVARDRTTLRGLHNCLAGHRQRLTSDMAEDYRAIHVLPPRSRQIAWGPGDADDVAMVELLDQTLALRTQTQLSAARVQQQQVELDRRAAWGFALDRQLQERTRWARSLEQQFQAAREQCAGLQQHAEDVEQQTRQQLTVMEGALAESELRRRQLRDRARERLREERRLVRSLAEQLADIAEDVRRTVSEQHRRERDFLAQLQTVESSRVELTNQLARSEAQREELISSSSWRLTAPIRVLSRALRQLAPGTAFRLRRLRGLLLRLESSLRSRGWRGTLGRIRDELRRRTPEPPAVQAPQPEEQFERLIVPCAQSPLVSIIIPVYGKLAYTVTCLKSLAAESSSFGIEVIVVDDCSPDDSFESLRKVEGIRLIRNELNLGFIGACNAGAALAQGDYLCFLNNDTAVQPGWLDALMGTFEQFPDCGLVGAKLIYPDGRLQEAGGIIFNDGAGWNYGRFDDPNDPRYDYPREADYCSGAAIVLSRELFTELGGFDMHYAPAYYEDTDLAFKVRARGLKVYYQPASRVVHYEGISSGTDTSSGIKRFQPINHEKFKQRWADDLQHQPAHDGQLVRLSCEHRVAGRILLIDATTPTPDQDSGSVRLMNLLRLLVQEQWKVVFFADNRAHVPTYTDAVKALGVEAQYYPWLSDPVRFFRERGHEFDAVLICRHYIASNYLKLVREHCPRARFIFDTVDLHYLREQRAAGVAGDDGMRRQAEQTRRQELELIRASDVTVVVSPVEQSLLAAELPEARVDVLSNIHEIAGRRRAFAERKGIFFVGGFQHVPNVDAVMWFVSEVWERIRAELPELQFHIVGSKMPAEVRELDSVPGVVIEGFVETIDPFLDGCRIAVAPLRYGAGVKGKVNSSMAHGQPVVMTSVAAEGMFLEHGVHGLIADSPTDFAEQVVRLYADEALWLKISDAGLQNVEENFSMQAARDALRKVLVG